MIPVAANDVAFSAHAVLLTVFTLAQIVMYDVSAGASTFLTVFKVCVLFKLCTIKVCDVSNVVSISLFSLQS